MIANSFAQQFQRQPYPAAVGPDMRPVQPQGPTASLPSFPASPGLPTGVTQQPVGIPQGPMMPQSNTMALGSYQPPVGPDMRPQMPGQSLQAPGMPQGNQLPANMQTDPNGYAQMMQRMQSQPSQF